MVTGLLAPILAVPIPPLTDYPNHLARGLFLADGARDAVMQRIFAVHWSIIPNLATDLLLPPLMQMMPPLVAGRLVIALAVLLPSVGAIAVSRLWSGRWSLWSLGAGFVAYNTMFLIGVLNFQIAVGVALWGVACWLALADRSLWLASLTGALFAIGAFICHLFGFAFYALLIGCAELAQIDQRGLRDPASRRFAAARCLAALGAVIAPVLLYLAAPFAAAGGEIYWQSPGKKFDFLLVPLLAYSRPLALVAAGAIALPLAVWALRRRLRVARLAAALHGLCLAAGGGQRWLLDRHQGARLAGLPAVRLRRSARSAALAGALSCGGARQPVHRAHDLDHPDLDRRAAGDCRRAARPAASYAG
jgi:hypothetical protein